MKYKLKVRNKHTHCQRRHSEGDVMANGADVWGKKVWGLASNWLVNDSLRIRHVVHDK